MVSPANNSISGSSSSPSYRVIPFSPGVLETEEPMVIDSEGSALINSSSSQSYKVIPFSPGVLETEEPMIIDSEGGALIHRLPLEVLHYIFLCATWSDSPGNLEDLYNIKDVCKFWRHALSGVSEHQWNRILAKGNLPSAFPLLQPFAQSIEKTMGGDNSYFCRFRKLTQLFHNKGFVPISYPMLGIQPSHYAEIYRDASLEAIWSKIEVEVFTGGLPVEAAAIRGWLNDPANIERITRIKFLDLSDLGLEMLPPEIGRFTQLKKLELDGNKLSSLPSEIGNLTRLTYLHLRGNQLTSLPPQIGNLTRLKQLFLDDNQLTSLPSKFGNLTRLTYLNLRGNQLTSLPSEISNLTRLTGLYLHGNPLMFIFNRDWTEKSSYSSLDHSELMLKYLRSSNHFCRTPLATLCQGIHCGDDDIALQKKFNALSSEMQELIRSKWEAPPLSPFLPSSSTDRALFNRALISMLRDKFMALSLEQRSQIYDHVSKFAGQAQGGSNWGKLHAEDNIIGLIDAMELATNQKNLKRKYNET